MAEETVNQAPEKPNSPHTSEIKQEVLKTGETTQTLGTFINEMQNQCPFKVKNKDDLPNEIQVAYEITSPGNHDPVYVYMKKDNKLYLFHDNQDEKPIQDFQSLYAHLNKIGFHKKNTPEYFRNTMSDDENPYGAEEIEGRENVTFKILLKGSQSDSVSSLDTLSDTEVELSFHPESTNLLYEIKNLLGEITYFTTLEEAIQGLGNLLHAK